jgi:hypothetical protein
LPRTFAVKQTDGCFSPKVRLAPIAVVGLGELRSASSKALNRNDSLVSEARWGRNGPFTIVRLDIVGPCGASCAIHTNQPHLSRSRCYVFRLSFVDWNG